MFIRDEQAQQYGVTAVENVFLLEYLPQAKGDYVKVYLLGLYHSQNPGGDFGVPEMASELSMLESEVAAALRYWERKRLVTRMGGEPERYVFHNAGQRMLTGQTMLDADAQFVAFTEAVHALFGDRRKVRPSEISLAYEWVEDVGLPQEVVLMLLSALIVERGPGFSFKYAQQMAVRMREENARTPEDAETFLRHSRETLEGARAVLRRLGKRSRYPSEDELALYIKWTGEWGFTHDAVIAACQETTKGEPSYAYLDAILKGLRARGQAASGEQVVAQITQEKTERELVKEVLAALGVRSTPGTLLTTYRRWRERFPHACIVLCARVAMRKGGKLDALERLLEGMEKKGLTSEDAVNNYFDTTLREDVTLYGMYEASGHRGDPTPADRALLRGWRGMGFSDDMLLLAAEQARDANIKHAYIDSILKSWQAAGVHAPKDVQGKIKPRQPVGKRVGAQNYEQRQYTDAEFDAMAFDLLGDSL